MLTGERDSLSEAAFFKQRILQYLELTMTSLRYLSETCELFGSKELPKMSHSVTSNTEAT